MKVIKRNKQEVDFDPNKIIAAVEKANLSIADKDLRLSKLQIAVIADETTKYFAKAGHTPEIEEIQKFVIQAIMKQGAYEVGIAYTEYRYKRELARKANTTDGSILTLLNFENEELKQENSNKNPIIASTQRD